MTSQCRRAITRRVVGTVCCVRLLFAARSVCADEDAAAAERRAAASAVAHLPKPTAPHQAGGKPANEVPGALVSDVARYTTPAAPNYLRAGLEELGLLGLGLIHYTLNHDANARDWDFDYSWPSFRRKITGDGYAFDTNLFDTNFLSHPVAGTGYYLVGRGNRVSVLGSFTYALIASTLWELLGELREQASINDMLVTPVAGLVLGEGTFQLGALFDRSCATTANRVLGSVLAPFTALHDALDGLTPQRDRRCDRYGITSRGAHEFRLAVGLGALIHARGPAEPVHAATRLALHTRVIALDTFGQPGNAVRTFADGNVSELSVSLGFADTSWNDLNIRAAVVPFGLHYRSLSEHGAATAVGHECIFGLLVATEYVRYHYDRVNDRQGDRYFSLNIPGASFGYVYRGAFGRLELHLRVGATWAGVDAFALEQYIEHASEETLTSVARSRGYNYAGGFTVEPHARLIMRHIEFGFSLRANRLWAITALDRYPEQRSHIRVLEIRRNGALWLTYVPVPSAPWRISFLSTVADRWGSIATAQRGRTDVRVGANVECVLQ